MNHDTSPLTDLVAEARRVVAAAAAGGLSVRVLGGVGVALHDHTPEPPALRRTFGDIDIVVAAKTSKCTLRVLTDLGYSPNERFNALHGASRMLFYDHPNHRQLDVFVGSFAMCHRLDLTGRLEEHPLALGAADLLLTKLQIHEVNRKDLIDAVRLIHAHELADTPPTPAGSKSDDVLALDRLREVTANDWGWYTTVTDNLGQVRAAAMDLFQPAAASTVTGRVDQITDVLDSAPKSMRWRARKIVGRKNPWYELPEEVDGRKAP